MKSLKQYILESSQYEDDAICNMQHLYNKTFCLCYCKNDKIFDAINEYLSESDCEHIFDADDEITKWFVISRKYATEVENYCDDNNQRNAKKGKDWLHGSGAEYFEIPTDGISYDDLQELIIKKYLKGPGKDLKNITKEIKKF